MKCKESQCTAPISSFVCNDTMSDDGLRRLIASSHDVDPIEDAITGLPLSEPAIEGTLVVAGDLQDHYVLEAMAPLVSEGSLQGSNPLNDQLLSEHEEVWDLGFLHHDGDQNWLDSYDLNNWLPLGPVERNDFQNSPDLAVLQHVGESARDPGKVLQAYFDLYQPEDPPETYQLLQSYPDPVNRHSAYSAPSLNIDCAYESPPNEVWSERGQHEQENPDSFPTCCNICLACIAIDQRVVTTCGHVFCVPCLSGWLQDEAKPCPECSTLFNVDANVTTIYANLDMDNTGSNVESRIDNEFEYASELMTYQQGYQPGFAHAQNWNIGIEGLNQAVQDLPLEYQRSVHLEVWQSQSGNQSDRFHGLLHNQAVVAESESSVDDAAVAIALTSKQAEQQSTRKRGREKTTSVVDHNGVAMRFDGVEERFTAYYRPSYWTEDDSAVFLGEYPTFEEATDAHNLVALLHEGPHAQIDLTLYTADKYAEELKRWEGKHHVDLVCALRLRGRGYLKDGSVNYKHVSRRRATKKAGTTRMRYFSTVYYDPGQFSNAKTGKRKRASLQTFDTPEEAARYADEVLVKQKGVAAWTNFPLSSYITSEDELPLTFLPLSNNFRENLAYKRARDF